MSLSSPSFLRSRGDTRDSHMLFIATFFSLVQDLQATVKSAVQNRVTLFLILKIERYVYFEALWSKFLLFKTPTRHCFRYQFSSPHFLYIRPATGIEKATNLSICPTLIHTSSGILHSIWVIYLMRLKTNSIAAPQLSNFHFNHPPETSATRSR